MHTKSVDAAANVIPTNHKDSKSLDIGTQIAIDITFNYLVVQITTAFDVSYQRISIISGAEY